MKLRHHHDHGGECSMQSMSHFMLLSGTCFMCWGSQQTIRWSFRHTSMMWQTQCKSASRSSHDFLNQSVGPFIARRWHGESNMSLHLEAVVTFSSCVGSQNSCASCLTCCLHAQDVWYPGFKWLWRGAWSPPHQRVRGTWIHVPCSAKMGNVVCQHQFPSLVDWSMLEQSACELELIIFTTNTFFSSAHVDTVHFCCIGLEVRLSMSGSVFWFSHSFSMFALLAMASSCWQKGSCCGGSSADGPSSSMPEGFRGHIFHEVFCMKTALTADASLKDWVHSGPFSSAKWSILQTKRLHLMPTTKTEPAMQSQVSTPTFLSAKWSVLQIKRLHLNNQAWTSNTEHPCQPQPFHLQNRVFCRPKGCTSCQQPRLNLPCRVKCQPQSFYLQNGVLCRSKGCTSTTKLEPPTQSTHANPNLFICKMECFADQKVAPHANNQDWTCHAESSVNPNLFICKMECFADQKVAPQQPSLNLQHRAPMPTPTFSSAKWSVLQTKRLHLMPTTKTEPAMQSQVSTPTFLSAKWSVLQIKRLHLNNQAWTSNTEHPCQPQPFHLQNGRFADQKVAPHANNQDWTCHAESSVTPTFQLQNGLGWHLHSAWQVWSSVVGVPGATFWSAKCSILQMKRLGLAWVLCVGGSSLVVEVQPFDLQNTPFCR